MGVQVLPRFSVFHRLPALAATYQTLRFLGSTSMSDNRPVVSVGPMLRKASPLNASELSRSLPPWPDVGTTAATNTSTPSHVPIRRMDALQEEIQEEI